VKIPPSHEKSSTKSQVADCIVLRVKIFKVSFFEHVKLLQDA
jgi:hypothetical protein